MLVLLLGAGLTLIGLVNHEVHQREWKKQKIKGAANVRDRVVLVVVGFSAIYDGFCRFDAIDKDQGNI